MKVDVESKVNEEKCVVSAKSSRVETTAVKFQSKTEKITTSSTYVGISNSGKSVTDNIEYTFSPPRTVHSVAPLITPVNSISMSSAGKNSNTVTVSSHLSLKNKYSDYSSGDELDFDDQKKTDYTYASSSQDFVSPPNMSRVRLRSSSTPYPDRNSFAGYFSNVNYENVSRMVNHLGQSGSVYSPTPASMSGNGKSSYMTGFNKQGLVYGLDNESDDDELDMQIDRRERYFEQKNSRRSKIRMVADIAECVIPVTAVWQKFWSVIYWSICYVLLLDTWSLSRWRKY